MDKLIKELYDREKARTLKYKDTDIWNNSDNAWLKYTDSTRKGRFGQNIMADSITQVSTPAVVVNEGIGDCDIYLSEFGISIEHKLATLDVNGYFQFNGISKKKDYHLVIGLGVTPDNLYFCIASRTWLNQKLTTEMTKDGGGFKWTKKMTDCLELTENNLRTALTRALAHLNSEGYTRTSLSQAALSLF